MLASVLFFNKKEKVFFWIWLELKCGNETLGPQTPTDPSTGRLISLLTYVWAYHKHIFQQREHVCSLSQSCNPVFTGTRAQTPPLSDQTHTNTFPDPNPNPNTKPFLIHGVLQTGVTHAVGQRLHFIDALGSYMHTRLSRC